MNFIERTLSSEIEKAFQSFPVVTITGPRQAGKSTLIKKLFPKLPYVNLESAAYRRLAEEDPVGFLRNYQSGAIFDEVQRSPSLFSEIQVLVDEIGQNSLFVLSGSQNFLLLEKISQSLAGRTALFHILPFTQEELADRRKNTVEERMFFGGYPRIFDQGLDPSTWLDTYMQTYIERDVRSLRNVSDLDQFRLFVQMCAARSGQLLDLTSLGNDCGVTSNTAKAWVSLLETSFILFRLQPFYKNFSKRLIKSPKIYFWDSGLLCHLLNIQSPDQLNYHASRGHIFETYIISELKRYLANHRLNHPLYFWRDKTSEVDCLIETQRGTFVPVEIKSSSTYNNEFRKSIDYLKRVSGTQPRSAIIYTGSEEQEFADNLHLLSESKLTRGIKLLCEGGLLPHEA